MMAFGRPFRAISACLKAPEMLVKFDPTGATNTVPGLTNNREGTATMAKAQFIPIPPRVKDHTGRRFGRLVVLGLLAMDQASNKNHPKFLCICDCGREHTTRSRNLTSGMVKSCGCLSTESANAARRHVDWDKVRASNRSRATHGRSHTPEHNTWTGMKQRCSNPKNKRYSLYGGRGIKVCQRWRESFDAFFEDMGARPTDDHSIDRIDSDGDYAPDNCRWATADEQANNKRDNHVIAYKGEKMTIKQASDASGICSDVLSYRIRKGWPEVNWFNPVKR